MKTNFTLLIIVILLSCCSPSLKNFRPSSSNGYIKSIVIRRSDGDTVKNECLHAKITAASNDNDLILTSNTGVKILLQNIKGMTNDRGVYYAIQPETKTPSVLSLYFQNGYMDLSGRWLIQVTPIVRGSMRQENKSEVMYLISDRNICD